MVKEQASAIDSRLCSGWREAGRDLVAGLVVSLKASLMACGAAALAAVGLLASVPEARGTLARALPAILPINTAVAALAEHVAGPAVVETAATDESPTEAEDDDITASSDPRQRAVTQYLSKRYRVADEAVGRVVAAAWFAGRDQQVDPLLILAVVAIESSMNPFAESAMGAQGLMQVMTHVHADKFVAHGGDSAALDPVANVRVGSAILADLIRRGGSVERGLQLYVGAGNHSDDGGYSARVLAEHARLRIAQSGRVSAALSAAYVTDAKNGSSSTPASSTLPAAKEAPSGRGAERASLPQRLADAG